MLDGDNIRKDAVPSLDSVTLQTAVPNRRVRRFVFCTLGGLCVVMRQHSICMPRSCIRDFISDNKPLVGFS
jgi:hypothetical protein